MAKKRGKEIRTRVNPDPSQPSPFDVTWSIPIVEEKFTIGFISVI